jgi:glutathione S-transferase
MRRMNSCGRYRLIGGNGSPYSAKLRGVMRYRRLPFDWVLRTPDVERAVAHVKPRLVPVLQLPQEAGAPEEPTFLLDSTVIVQALETRHPDRSVFPPHPGLRFLNLLVEDMADEWGTKAMFELRWRADEDQAWASRWIVADTRPDLEGDAFEAAVAAMRQRQVSRMPLVGCTPQNAPLLNESYVRVLDILQPWARPGRFLFGTRPGIADFAWYGMLRILYEDPTPSRIMRDRAPMVVHWVRSMDDASGLDGGGWCPSLAELPAPTRELLELAGKTHLPFLAANAAALQEGRERVSLEIMGRPYEQVPFPYQAKCLQALRRELDAVGGPEGRELRSFLADHGCLRWLEPAA